MRQCTAGRMRVKGAFLAGRMTGPDDAGHWYACAKIESALRIAQSARKAALPQNCLTAFIIVP